MRKTDDINKILPEEIEEPSDVSEALSEIIKTDEAQIAVLTEKIAEQTAEFAIKVSELSHMNKNEGATGFNPTLAEMAEVFEGIKTELQELGK
jgi:hypothetical protein